MLSALRRWRDKVDLRRVQTELKRLYPDGVPEGGKTEAQLVMESDVWRRHGYPDIADLVLAQIDVRSGP